MHIAHRYFMALPLTVLWSTWRRPQTPCLQEYLWVTSCSVASHTYTGDSVPLLPSWPLRTQCPGVCRPAYLEAKGGGGGEGGGGSNVVNGCVCF